jgi:hypothetical protein
MKWITTIVTLIASTVLFAGPNNDHGSNDPAVVRETSDSTRVSATLASYVSPDKMMVSAEHSLSDVDRVIRENMISGISLGKTKTGRTIHAFYFPGKTSRRALVIAGVHGSELSSLEVANALLQQLMQGQQPYYSVVVVPSLFPDNAIVASNNPLQIGSVANIGRYSKSSSVDPNRQMPTPGKAYDDHDGTDHLGRMIETENQLLLKLIQSFKPQRIINIHAIRNTGYGGVYADPRTDHKGIALGYETDSSLALSVATYIDQRGGNVAGNHLENKPTALYYKDPVPVPAGYFQKRNMTGSVLNANRGSGVSLGTWASTAIDGGSDLLKSRDAIRILTMEYPGCLRPIDYKNKTDRLFQQNQIGLYASAIMNVFLGNFFTEDPPYLLAGK